MTHGPGTIILPCQELARYHRFTMSLASVKKPEGTQVTLGVGMSITDNLNSALRALRPEDEWVWILGDDHYFAPDVLMQLLEREADIIAPLCTYRMPPFGLVHYDAKVEGTDIYSAIKIADLPTHGEPFEVEASGSLMLIRRHVLDTIGDPWYGHANWRLSEDLYFCERAREEGFKILVDPAVTVGHIGNFIAYPQMRDGVWGVAIDFGQGHSIFYPGGVDENAAAVGRLEPALA